MSEGHELAAAAAKAGMDEKSARKYHLAGRLPSDMKTEKKWRRRADPFETEWPEIVELLGEHPTLEARSMLGVLIEKDRDKFNDGHLRTLQRRFKIWRALFGPAKEIYFPQTHIPGELGQSDFTSMNDLTITIAGRPFEHLLYHFVLTYSNWEAVTVCRSESFESLSQGFQNALCELGGVPSKHRSDRLSAAVNNLKDPIEFTKRYMALMRHYGVTPERIQTGCANENGDVEQAHHRFRRAVEQALIFRGSRDFTAEKEYEAFLSNLSTKRNVLRKERLTEERGKLLPLPPRRLADYTTERVRVTKTSMITVAKRTYSVPSRLVGENVEARIFGDRIELRYAEHHIETMPRLCGKRNHRVDYRHIIEWLCRKPHAFRNYRYHADLFPTTRFRMAYDELKAKRPLQADREYLAILEMAATVSESAVDTALDGLFAKEAVVTFDAVEAVVIQSEQPTGPREIEIEPVDLKTYDVLLECEKEAGPDMSEPEIAACTACMAVEFSEDATKMAETEAGHV